MKAEVTDTISLKRGAQIIGVGTRAYHARKANGLIAPITVVNGKEAHERQEFKRWLIENAAALGWEQNDARLLAMIEKLERDKMSTKKLSGLAGTVAIAALATFSAIPAHAQIPSGISVPVGTPTVVIPAAGPGSARTFQRIVNPGNSASDGAAWCTRGASVSAITSAQFLAAFGVHKAGTFVLAPYGNSAGYPSAEEFDGSHYVPQTATICLSDGGTSGSAAAQLTVETSQ